MRIRESHAPYKCEETVGGCASRGMKNRKLQALDSLR
jgi:hypothetical protein